MDWNGICIGDLLVCVCALWLSILMSAYVCIHVVVGMDGCYAYIGVASTESESTHTTPVRAKYESHLPFSLTEHSYFAHQFTLYDFQVLSDWISTIFELVLRRVSFGLF